MNFDPRRHFQTLIENIDEIRVRSAKLQSLVNGIVDISLLDCSTKCPPPRGPSISTGLRQRHAPGGRPARHRTRESDEHELLDRALLSRPGSTVVTLQADEIRDRLFQGLSRCIPGTLILA